MKRALRMFAAAAALSAMAIAGPSVVPASGAQGSTTKPRAAAPPAKVDPAAKHRDDVTARTEALGDWVTALTDEMNRATGQAKVDAMARLLNALVQHRSMMLQEMKMMQDDLDAQHEMMRRMMHRGMGGTPSAPADPQ